VHYEGKRGQPALMGHHHGMRVLQVGTVHCTVRVRGTVSHHTEHCEGKRDKPVLTAHKEDKKDQLVLTEYYEGKMDHHSSQSTMRVRWTTIPHRAL
jgi:hypothetical protein